MGLTQEDAEAAAALPSVDKVTPARVTDVLVSSPDGDLLSARMYGMDLNDTDSVNQLTLLEGSMPEKAGECVIENPNSSMTDLSIGDTITLSEDTENLEDTYRQRTFTTVSYTHLYDLSVLSQLHLCTDAHSPVAEIKVRIEFIRTLEKILHIRRREYVRHIFSHNFFPIHFYIIRALFIHINDISIFVNYH